MTINTRYFFLLTFLLLLPIAKADKIEQFNEAFARSVQNKLNAQSIPGGAYVIVHKNIVIDLKSFGYTDKTQRKKS
jgi:CubicO group peptidase (beta-lactamase class C family)